MEKEHRTEQKIKTDNKKPYEAPKIIFIPLRIEERLMACNNKRKPNLS